KALLATLYTSGFLNLVPKKVKNNTDTFWQCFKNSLSINIRGGNGKCHILSVIANAFTYEEIKENLGVSNDAINAARYHANVYSSERQIVNKPIVTHEKMSAEKEQQIQQFLANKANVVMSSYKTDSMTNEPVYYLKHSKDILWERFREEYPNGMKRTSFYAHLQEGQYLYRENLGGLCQTCSKYGYDTFEELTEYIRNNIKDH
ncbi:2938_t:CDS:2, partial [Cetraspora pellucida]